MITIHDELRDLVRSALQGYGIDASEEAVALEYPADPTFGDYSTNVALALSKRLGVSPREIADKIVSSIQSAGNPNIEKVEVAGPGFVNFTLSGSFFNETIKAVQNQGDAYGSNSTLSGRRILIEYTDPNAFKEFHIGHLMSNTIGESLARLTERSGAQVTRLCYQSDIGLNVAKAVWGMRQNEAAMPNDDAPLSERVSFVGRSYVFGSNQYEDDAEAKAEIDTMNRKLYEKSDPSLESYYRKGRAWSLEHFDEIYRTLGTTFVANIYESDMATPALEIVKANVGKVFEESEGAIVFKAEQYGLHTRVFINRFGLPTYEAKDLALAAFKAANYEYDKSIVITADEQTQYFQVVLKALSMISPDVAANIMHIAHGMMRFVDGKMSSRKGNVITGESLITDMRAKVAERMVGREMSDAERSLAEVAVAVAAIKYSILRQSPGKSIVFDPDTALSFEGDSGPYLQYARSRARAVLRKAEEQRPNWTGEPMVRDDAPSRLERLIHRFPHVVGRARAEYAPQLVVVYLTELAGAYNSYYASTQILDSGERAPYRLALTDAFSVTMANGLEALGMTPLERM